jgi:hypothetical protein
MDERAASAAPSGARDDDVGAAVAAVVQGARARLLSILELGTAEMRLAALSSLSMLLLAIVASAALIIAWILVVALVIFAAGRAGVDWPWAAAVLAVLHVGVAGGAWRGTVRLSRNLTLPQLRGVLGSDASARPAAAYVPVTQATSARRA